MVHLANKAQPVRVGVLYPRGVYSRQVGLEIKVPLGMGNGAFNFTDIVGQQVWLLGVDLWFFGVDPGIVFGGFWEIATGTTVPANPSEILTDWSKVMDYRGIKPYKYWWGVESAHFHWTMNRYYSGAGRRFAFAALNGFDTPAWWVHAFFEISEG